MRRILARTPGFARRVFSEQECAYCTATALPEAHFSTRFAAKEAVLKALGTGFSAGIGVRDIEVCRNAKGRPFVRLYGRAKEAAQRCGILEIPLSLSYTHGEAVACAMAITAESVKASQTRADAMEELTKRFKEARSLLDGPAGAKEGEAEDGEV